MIVLSIFALVNAGLFATDFVLAYSHIHSAKLAAKAVAIDMKCLYRSCNVSESYYAIVIHNGANWTEEQAEVALYYGATHQHSAPIIDEKKFQKYFGRLQGVKKEMIDFFTQGVCKDSTGSACVIMEVKFKVPGGYYVGRYAVPYDRAMKLVGSGQARLLGEYPEITDRAEFDKQAKTVLKQ